MKDLNLPPELRATHAPEDLGLLGGEVVSEEDSSRCVHVVLIPPANNAEAGSSRRKRFRPQKMTTEGLRAPASDSVATRQGKTRHACNVEEDLIIDEDYYEDRHSEWNDSVEDKRDGNWSLEDYAYPYKEKGSRKKLRKAALSCNERQKQELAMEVENMPQAAVAESVEVVVKSSEAMARTPNGTLKRPPRKHTKKQKEAVAKVIEGAKNSDRPVSVCVTPPVGKEETVNAFQCAANTLQLVQNEESSLVSAQAVAAVDEPDEKAPVAQALPNNKAPPSKVSNALAAQQPRRDPRKVQRPFQCNACWRSFDTAEKCSKHRAIHDSPKPFKCDFCDKRFRQPGNRDLHHRVHTLLKPHECDLCQLKFRFPSELATHRSKELNILPDCCDICGKRFRDGGALRRHKLRFHKDVCHDVRVQCKCCKYYFASKALLDVHVCQPNAEDNESSLKCPICAITFLSAPELIGHPCTDLQMRKPGAPTP